MARMLWTPPADVRQTTQMGRLATLAEQRTGRSLPGYEALWEWSVEDLAGFWSTLWDFYDIPHSGSRERVLTDPVMPFSTWFPDVQLNYAEAMLRLAGRADDEVVVKARSEARPDSALTVAELREQVGRARAGLRARGIGKGDRVVGYLPNIPEALVLMLATTSLGAIWSACPPEFGVPNVLDRWSQIVPSLVVAVDGYRYRGKDIDRREEIARIADALGLRDRLVTIPYLYDEGNWAELLPAVGELAFERVPFDHPLWILFSSGTTGPPKPIVHGHGGVTLELHKLQGIAHDLKPSDTYLWFTTTGWVMWNLQVCGLLVGATIVLFDGDPGGSALWRLAADMEVTYFGVSAPFLMQCRKSGIAPSAAGDLSRIREVGSTGAPLPPEGFEWLYEQLGPSIRVNSTSGGTDVCTSFVGGAPLLPVRAGEIACRQLACKVEAWGDDGKPLIGEVGEMVVTAPMPSMPIEFWGDTTGERYRSTYFEQYSGVWRHGDWITIHPDGHCVISGRSDATLNRGGVRLGTAEFYRVVENLEGVADSLVVHLDSVDGDAGQLLLFVVPTEGRRLDDGLEDEVRRALRTQLSPRHVPDKVHAVPSVPKTLSGKKLEVPVKKILRGAEPSQVAAPGALSNPASLDTYVALRPAAPVSG
ncbi:acetoacetate--CoA ligase [Streptomyces sp. NPDC094034]|uniref:acetoacetate--CoA ligase n=1 Tax=Streptomyces sp. NPDC094034 TaxID=3155309 RepID=UPI00331BB72B